MLRRLLQKWLVRLVAGSWTVDTTKIRPAFVDQLTGLSTRYVLIDRLRVAREDGTPGSVAVIDIDHFKLFNDRFGHQIGDGLIEVVAKRLDAVVPNGACLSRLGGDEFALFVPNVDVMAAKVLLEHFLERLRQPVAIPDGSSHVVTASVGIAAFAGQSIDDTLRASDVALYAAKARGRDRVVVFDDDTREVLTARRELAAAVIDLQERNRALRDEARTDALTGLRNRMALNEVLDVVVGSSDSAWSRAGVAFIDIDHFGAYNHLHGDSAGDEALRRVAAAIRAVSRESDIVFRKGGEEIVVLLVDVVRETAAMAAERLRAAVFELAIPHRGSTTAPIMSVTVGVATGEPGCCIRDLMESASDQAMSAKVRGARNQVLPVHLEVGWRNKAFEAGTVNVRSP
jgi:diguanylate cyclase (GGDEF)-like protein